MNDFSQPHAEYNSETGHYVWWQMQDRHIFHLQILDWFQIARHKEPSVTRQWLNYATSTGGERSAQLPPNSSTILDYTP